MAAGKSLIGEYVPPLADRKLDAGIPPVAAELEHETGHHSDGTITPGKTDHVAGLRAAASERAVIVLRGK
jgi:hypothetical protein